MRILFRIAPVLFWSTMASMMTPSFAQTSPALSDSPFVKIPHKAFNIPCEACHTTATWKILKPRIEFDHAKTGFALIGTHVQTACNECHAGGKFSTAIRECSMCHKDPHQNQLGLDCERCHSELAWAPSRFSHDDQNLFMFGAHKGLECASCHKNTLTFKMPNIQECGDCHIALGATTDHNKYKTIGDCLSCHNLNGWNNNPHLDEWFSLSGHHKQNCERCHKQIPNYTTYTCRDCHRFVHKGEGGDD